MIFESLAISGLVLIIPKRHGDGRGWFSETFRDDWFRQQIADVSFVQQNQSYSSEKGTVRGLHFQVEPKAQGKLVRCSRGRLLDVAVDLRASSGTYGRHVAIELTANNGHQLWIPPGFAHGFCTLEPDCELSYLVTAYYSSEHDRGVLWSDPAIGIRWPVNAEQATLSPKDQNQPRLAEIGALFC